MSERTAEEGTAAGAELGVNVLKGIVEVFKTDALLVGARNAGEEAPARRDERVIAMADLEVHLGALDGAVSKGKREVKAAGEELVDNKALTEKACLEAFKRHPAERHAWEKVGALCEHCEPLRANCLLAAGDRHLNGRDGVRTIG
jgi:hypothetical protein